MAAVDGRREMPQLGVGRRQRRHQHDHVAERAKKNSAVPKRQADVISDALAWREGRFRLHDRRRARCRTSGRPAGCRRRDGCAASGASASRSTRAFRSTAPMIAPSDEQSERRERRGTTERVARVGVAVKKVAVLVVAAEERVVDAIGGQRRRHRKISARQPLRDAHQDPASRPRAGTRTSCRCGRMPVATSSRISSAPWRAARRGGARQKSRGSVSMPAAACTPGSRITAHTRPSARRSACSSSSAQSIEQSAGVLPIGQR